MLNAFKEMSDGIVNANINVIKKKILMLLGQKLGNDVPKGTNCHGHILT